MQKSLAHPDRPIWRQWIPSEGIGPGQENRWSSGKEIMRLCSSDASLKTLFKR